MSVTDRDALSYEQARDELASVVRKLEAGGLSLEQSLDLWEHGEKLAAICAEWLEGARARLTAVMAARDGDGADDSDGQAEKADKASPSGKPRWAARDEPGAPF
jgi:exodeoxyribonuclease VII small subunit